MSEPLQSYLIQQYLAKLSRELKVQGLRGKRLEEILTETEDHLAEAMAAAQPQSGLEVERIISQFGSASVLAKRLTLECERNASSKPYLWPVAFFIVALAVFRFVPWTYTFFRPAPGTSGNSGFTIFGHQFFPAGLWIGSVVLAAAAVTLFVLGYRARRPSVGQFIAAAAVLTVVGSFWYMATSYPMVWSGGSSEWLQPVARSEYSSTLAQMNGSVDAEREIARLMTLGKTVFSAKGSPATTPKEFRYGDRYFLPEGLREVKLGIPPSKIHPFLLAASWTEAVSNWTSPNSNYIRQLSGADRVLFSIPETIRNEQASIANLKWIHDQPMKTQAPLDFKMAMEFFLPVALMAMFCSLAGWLAWLFVRFMRRLIRRIKDQAEPMIAT